MDKTFASMIGVQLTAVIGGLFGGGIITVLVQPFVLNKLPQDQWTEIISWILSAVVGYVSIGFIIPVVLLIGTAIIFILET